MLHLVEETLQSQFASMGWIHEDVAWRKIGLYKNGPCCKAVVFDLGRMRDSRDTTTKGNSVKDAISKL